VARRLAERGVPQRLVVRDADRAPKLPGADVVVAPGYHDRRAMAKALRGADTLLLVSGRESATRVEEHVSAIDAAVDAGVQRVVYTSFLGAAPDAVFTLARQHDATERHILSTGLSHTFLRSAMYLDFVPFLASADGVIAGPGGDGRCAFVARDDVADVAVALLTDPIPRTGRTYDVTGEERLSLTDAAAVLAEVAGRPVRYVEETVAEAYASRAHHGAPAFEVEGWVTSYEAIAAGELDVVTDVVRTLTGRAPLGLREFLAADPSSWAHLRPA
jgi:uncharacterized protein YbjT (DUF2867 family)